MSTRSKILSNIAVLTLACAAGVGLACGAPARAATSACGPACTDTSPQASPLDVAAVLNGTAQVGQDVILFPAAPAAPEDFILLTIGPVSALYTAGIVGPAVGLTWPSDIAYEYEYAPNGTPSALCMGVAVTAANGTHVTLQPCGLTARTVWISLAIDTINGSQPLINGSDTVTGAPYVLTAGSPKSVLTTRQLFLVAGTFATTQMWRNLTGIL
jgi:hypothetical protein